MGLLGGEATGLAHNLASPLISPPPTLDRSTLAGAVRTVLYCIVKRIIKG